MQKSFMPETLRLMLRRLAAALYDMVAITALWFVGTYVVLPFTGGHAVPAESLWFQTYLLSMAAGYFVISWRRGGQTLGARAWRIQVATTTGDNIGWWQALWRFTLAIGSWLCAGLGFFWALLPGQQSWHDRLADTRVERT